MRQTRNKKTVYNFNREVRKMARVKKIHQPLPLGTIAAKGLGLKARAALKFWQPDGRTAWYIAESDNNGTFYGVVVDNGKTELRYFTRDEIENHTGVFGLPAELDFWYTPQTLRDLLAGTAW